MANSLYRLHRNDQALRWARRAVHFAPENIRYLLLLGSVHSALGQLSQTRLYWLEALRIAPNNPRVRSSIQYLRDHGVSDLPPP